MVSCTGTGECRCSISTRRFFEHLIQVDDPERGEPQVMGRIVLHLDQPTRAGETEIEIELVTYLPAEVSAILICEA